MRYLIAVDLEGIHGVLGEPYKTLTDARDYGLAAENAAKEINAAVCALFDEGAELVAVWDNHGGGGNIDFSKVDGRVVKIDASKDEYRFDFAKEYGFDAIIFIGYHAMEGSMRGILAHSYSSVAIQYIELNGVRMGELGVDSLICGELGIKPIFLASDDVCIEEMRSIIPDIWAATTKLAEGRNRGTLLPEADVLASIYEGVRRSARGFAPSAALKLGDGAALEIRYTRAERAAEEFQTAARLGIPAEYGRDSHTLRFKISAANQITKLT